MDQERGAEYLIQMQVVKNRRKLTAEGAAAAPATTHEEDDTLVLSVRVPQETPVAINAKILRTRCLGPPCASDDRLRPLTAAKKYRFPCRPACNTVFHGDAPPDEAAADRQRIYPPLSTAHFCWKNFDPAKRFCALDILMLAPLLSKLTEAKHILLTDESWRRRFSRIQRSTTAFVPWNAECVNHVRPTTRRRSPATPWSISASLLRFCELMKYDA